MHQKGFNMIRLWVTTLGWLIYGFTAVCEPALGTNADPSCCRKICHGITYDNREAVCCGTQLHLGAGWSCCGDQPFNPATATCCETRHGNTFKAQVTEGLSAKVSTCCGLKAFNALNEKCCESTVVARPAAKAECCGKEAYDKQKQLCCHRENQKVILVKNSTHHRCCGHNQYDTKTQCCCWKNQTHAEAEPIDSHCCVKDSVTVQTCGLKTYNEAQLCCESNVVTKPSSKAKCCGAEAYDVEKQLCCGLPNHTKILVKNSTDHLCCGHSQYNFKTECCCWNDDGSAEGKPKNSQCCATISDVQRQKPEPQPICIEPNTHLCGSSCYNPNEFRCCERKETRCCAPGQCGAAFTVYNPHTQVCCDGCLLKPEMDQCCGDPSYGAARGVLCCHNALYKDREDGEECSDTSIPYNPTKGTICCSQFHGSPGKHCCGTEVYQPSDEICCGGHRYPRKENPHCCGVKAYNIKDPKMKCCAGMLYNLTHLGNHEGDAKCCGSVLQKPQEVCCSSKDEMVLYSRKTGFGCCGHLYFNLSLWSCCAGSLSPVHQSGQQQSNTIESRLLSVNNLGNESLCRQIYIGIVESVSLNSIIFGSVLELHGTEAKVQPCLRNYTLMPPDHCSIPKLILGKFYFFNDGNVFTDLNHDSVLQSLYFIFTKCSPEVTTC